MGFCKALDDTRRYICARVCMQVEQRLKRLQHLRIYLLSFGEE